MDESIDCKAFKDAGLKRYEPAEFWSKERAQKIRNKTSLDRFCCFSESWSEKARKKVNCLNQGRSELSEFWFQAKIEIAVSRKKRSPAMPIVLDFCRKIHGDTSHQVCRIQGYSFSAKKLLSALLESSICFELKRSMAETEPIIKRDNKKIFFMIFI